MADLALRLGNDMLTIEGAMGTMLIAQGADPGSGVELFNILEPETVGAIHRLYREAGADCAISNTFGGTRNRLAANHLADRLLELNRAGVLLAKEHNPEHVLGDVGPCGLYTGVVGTSGFEEVFQQYREQVEALVSAKPDGIIIETMIELEDARIALQAARSVTDLPVMVTISLDENGVMPLSGTTPEAAAVVLASLGASAVGINCGSGPEQLYPCMEAMSHATGLPLVIQPNAGVPEMDPAGNVRYKGTPEEAAYWAGRYRELGVQFVGSCCGSTPAFTGAINATLEHLPVLGRSVDEGDYIATSQARIALGDDVDFEEFDLDGYDESSLDDLEEDLLMTATMPDPVLLVGGDHVVLERALALYPGRAVVSIADDGDGPDRADRLATVDAWGAAACRDGDPAHIIATGD